MDILNYDPSMEPYVRLIVALLLGSVIGLERSYAGKTAGLRTFGLVSMGACLFILIAQAVMPTINMYNYDPLRVAAGIVTGIGFLSAGVIIFRGSQLSGLTTAAGIWVAAAVGTAAGYGLLALSIFATVATLLVFTVFWFIEDKFVRDMDGKGDADR